MDTTLHVICSAVKASLFNMPITLPDDVDWNEVFQESRKQAIASIVREGVKNQLPSELAETWKLFSIQEISYVVQLLEAQKELCSLLEEKGIKYVIIKGSAASIYYPEPYFRSMGDVDFWVPHSSFSTALDHLKKRGYFEVDGSDYRHLKLKKNNILFEMHRHVSNSEEDRPLDPYIEKAKLERNSIRGTEFLMLSEMENGLVLINHIRQHLIEGLGIRQVLDWMMYCDKVLDAEKWCMMLPAIHLNFLRISD